MKRNILFACILSAVMVPLMVVGATWPATGITTANTITMASPYEPSGLAWNEVTNKLFAVSDPTSDGQNRITMMNADGSGQVTWKSSGDFEALSIVDSSSNFIYVGVENAPAIKEFDITSAVNSPRFTKTWNLGTWLTNLGNSGVEGMAYVPNGFHPYSVAENHVVFYVGLQRTPDLNHTTATEYDDGLIYAFDVNLGVNGDVRYLGYLNLNYSVMPNHNVSDLYFSKDTGTLFVLYDDDSNYLFELSPDGGTVINTYTNVPGVAREGIVVKTTPNSDTAEVVIAHDSNFTITRHFNFPITRLGIGQIQDADGDGVADDVDCAPNDATISSPRAYYRDSDGDGLGFGSPENVCSLTPRAGYVANNSDINDNDFDNDNVSPSLDCNDRDSSISALQTYYLDADGDGLGTITSSQSICSYVAPTQYVSDSTDQNDHDYDNDGVETGVDCNDQDSNVVGPQPYYVDADGDSLGFGTVQYSCTLADGFVDNNNDINDHDYDNDGVETLADCNDMDQGISASQAYYRDADGDNLGTADIFQTVCSYTPPAGFVANHSDVNDHDYDNDGVETDIDCDDHNNSIFASQIYYVDADGDGLGFGQPQYSCFVPAGAVMNSSDQNDNDFDNDGSDRGIDCNDNDRLILGPQNYYRDHDNDGMGYGEPQQVCSPSGEYVVTNNNDQNDDDHDNDSISSSDDCDDNDDHLLGPSIYYRDFDQDGLGSESNFARMCTTVTPQGFVTNHDDYDDFDSDNDGKRTIDDCDDHDPAILGPHTYYRDYDEDGLGSPYDIMVICSEEPLFGFVTNDDDLNDFDRDNDNVVDTVDNCQLTYNSDQTDTDGDRVGDVCDTWPHDYDNDGVETVADCDDTNASLAYQKTFYQDKDNDKLGSKTVSISQCAMSVPQGYVTNSLDFDDEIPAKGIEIKGDKIDNDGDKYIDEMNTLSKNGMHPFLFKLDPLDAQLARRYIVSVASTWFGRVQVMYSDHAVYEYNVFNWYFGSVRVERYNGTAVLKVTKKRTGEQVYINGYTGARIALP